MLPGRTDRAAILSELALAKTRLNDLQKLLAISELPRAQEGLRRDIQEQEREISELERKLAEK
jgi:hypothetical protein